MNRLIAQVDTAIVVDGERRIVRAGQPLPDAVKADDRAELLAFGAARAAVNEAPDAPADADAPEAKAAKKAKA